MKEFSRENIRQQIEKLLPVMRGLVLNVRDAMIEDRLSLKTRAGNNFEKFTEENGLTRKSERLIPETSTVEFTPEDIAVSLVEVSPLYPEYREFTEIFKTRDRLLTTIADYKRICYLELNRVVGDDTIVNHYSITSMLIDMILKSSYSDFPGTQGSILSDEDEYGSIIDIYLNGMCVINSTKEDVLSDSSLVEAISDFIYNTFSIQCDDII